MQHTASRRILDNWKNRLVDLKMQLERKEINRIEALAKAKALFNHYVEKRRFPDRQILNCHLMLCEIKDDIKNVLRMFHQVGVFHNTITYNILISKSKNWEEAIALFKQMKEVYLRPSTMTINLLLNHCDTFEKAEGVFQNFRIYDLELMPSSFNPLICLARTNEQIANTINKMKLAGVKPDKFIFHSIISKAKTFDFAYPFLSEMDRHQLSVRVSVIVALLKKANTARHFELIEQELVKRRILHDSIWDFFFKSKRNQLAA